MTAIKFELEDAGRNTIIFLPFLFIILQAQWMVTKRSVNGQCIRWPFTKPGPLGIKKILGQTIPGEIIGLKFIPSQSEPFRFISIFVSQPIRIIPNQSKKRFVSRSMKNGQKSIRINLINSETSIWMNSTPSETKFSIQINPINPSSDWSKPNFQSESIRMNPRSEWFGLARIKKSEWIGIVLIDSEWILIRYFRQGNKYLS